MEFCLWDKRDIIIERYLFPWLSVLFMGIPNLPGWCNSYAIASSHSMEWGDGIIGHGSEWSHWDVSHGRELAGQHVRNTIMAGSASLLFSLRSAARIMWEPHQVVALDLYFLLMPHAGAIIQHQYSFLLQLASNFIQLHNYEKSEEFQQDLAWNLYIFSQGSHLFKSRNDVGYTYLVGRIPRFFPCANCAVAYRHSFLQWSDYRLWH